MAKQSGQFKRDSARRIARQVRRMEGMPLDTRASDPGEDRMLPCEFRRFVCKDALTPAEGNPGTTATAHLVVWNETDEEFEVKTDEDLEFEVRDSSGSRYAAAYDSTNWHRFIGWCVKAFDVPEWEIMYLPQWVMCKALTQGAVVAADATYTVDNVTVMYGTWPVSSGTDTLTVYNTFGDDIDDNAVVTIIWNQEQKRWETADITCPA